jgi:glycosyltransferase involved in cell wall biosynthesis
MRPQFERAGIRVLPLALDHYGGLKRNIAAFWQLARILRREPFDVIQTHTSVAGALGRVAARMFTRTPVVHMLHAFAMHRYRPGMSRRAALLAERRLDRWTDWYIAGSLAMVHRGLSQRIFTADKVVLISNGVELTQFPGDAGSESTPSEVTLPGRRQAQVTVGFLGRLEEEKGGADLIRAAAIVRQQNQHVRFRIAGDGTLRPQLERLAARLQLADTIEFVGWNRDSVGFLKQIDILAMPSLWEAFGLSAAEAMALGKPVIASRIGGLPEVVEEGRTGILVPPADPAALARAIVELAADPARRRALGMYGRARVEQFFTLDRMVSRHEEFYASLLGGGTSLLGDGASLLGGGTVAPWTGAPLLDRPALPERAGRAA